MQTISSQQEIQESSHAIQRIEKDGYDIVIENGKARKEFFTPSNKKIRCIEHFQLIGNIGPDAKDFDCNARMHTRESLHENGNIALRQRYSKRTGTPISISQFNQEGKRDGERVYRGRKGLVTEFFDNGRKISTFEKTISSLMSGDFKQAINALFNQNAHKMLFNDKAIPLAHMTPVEKSKQNQTILQPSFDRILVPAG